MHHRRPCRPEQPRRLLCQAQPAPLPAVQPLSFRGVPAGDTRGYYYDIQTKDGLSYVSARHGDDGRNGSLLRLRGRGWVFQEDLLSRRSLYFGAHGIFWECLGEKLDETHDVGDRCSWCHHDSRVTLKYQFAQLEADYSAALATGARPESRLTITLISTADGGIF